ncbi:hypothetical protein IEQ34_010701 [Dendrobium chrysotoxum]|uniref:Transmembrane protein n=1 Tax=Dendrobium chrysotoxum TaxID=161865 RepID=A0AAV7GWJ5_DENCH|nr:hypothetical protein IEQ34_010701 [Dendrobium chrysotoxum]
MGLGLALHFKKKVVNSSKSKYLGLLMPAQREKRRKNVVVFIEMECLYDTKAKKRTKHMTLTAVIPIILALVCARIITVTNQILEK